MKKFQPFGIAVKDNAYTNTYVGLKTFNRQKKDTQWSISLKYCSKITI